MTYLNLKKFPILESTVGLLAFNHLKEFPLLTHFGDLTERIYGCSKFLNYRVDEEYPFFIENAHLRAALNEFVSISEILKVSDNIKFNTLTIEKSDFPLLHFFKLMREVNFHLNSFQQINTINNVRHFDGVTGIIHEQIIPLTNTVIDKLNISIFKNSRNIKHYDLTQIEEVIGWIGENQYRWGIFHILDLALRQYCSEIENQYFH